ncbi:hypothetical protein ANN_20956 [Periplaneta americana]|uniref:Uncharacterized protein n=1 Tax=Periplaneta americana TaxID=6978 RepID=A0ABQ8SFB0_PERAM|nr:hypothetical protein ANN_20956 [Periplaneta americana]
MQQIRPGDKDKWLNFAASVLDKIDENNSDLDHGDGHEGTSSLGLAEELLAEVVPTRAVVANPPLCIVNTYKETQVKLAASFYSEASSDASRRFTALSQVTEARPHLPQSISRHWLVVMESVEEVEVVIEYIAVAVVEDYDDGDNEDNDGDNGSGGGSDNDDSGSVGGGGVVVTMIIVIMTIVIKVMTMMAVVVVVMKVKRVMVVMILCC